MIVSKTIVVIYIFAVSQCSQSLADEEKDFDSFIVGGLNVSDIKQFPHVVYILFACPTTGKWLCGGSVLTQNVFLTAGHCLTKCKLKIQAAAGSEDILKPKFILRDIDAYQQHENYDEVYHRHDLALLATRKPLPFGSNIKRVILMRIVPHGIKMAFVAGWGFTDRSMKPTNKLKYVSQSLETRHVCDEKLGESLGPGEMCAWNSHDHRPDMHDSGSALITKYGLQLGLVSCTFPFKRELILYTNVSYYYNWIHDRAKKLYCEVERIPNNRNIHEDEYYEENANIE